MGGLGKGRLRRLGQSLLVRRLVAATRPDGNVVRFVVGADCPIGWFARRIGFARFPSGFDVVEARRGVAGLAGFGRIVRLPVVLANRPTESVLLPTGAFRWKAFPALFLGFFLASLMRLFGCGFPLIPALLQRLLSAFGDALLLLFSGFLRFRPSCFGSLQGNSFGRLRFARLPATLPARRFALSRSLVAVAPPALSLRWLVALPPTTLVVALPQSQSDSSVAQSGSLSPNPLLSLDECLDPTRQPLPVLDASLLLPQSSAPFPTPSLRSIVPPPLSSPQCPLPSRHIHAEHVAFLNVAAPPESVDTDAPFPPAFATSQSAASLP